MNIRRDDVVIAIAGRHAGAGKSGKVLQVFPAKQRAIVEGLNVVKKAMRKTQDNPQGGIGEKECPMPISNLALYCPSCRRGVRVKRVQEGDKRVRKCKRCGHAF